VPPNAASYAELVRAAVVSGDLLLECADWLREAHRDGVAGYYPVFNARGALAVRLGGTMAHVLRAMVSAGIAADQKTLLAALEGAEAAMRAEPNCVAWGERAEACVKEFEREAEMEAGPEVCHAVMGIWARSTAAESVDASWRVLRKMERKAGKRADMAPTAETYALLVESAVVADRMPLAISAFNELEQRGLRPNEATFQALVRGFGKQLQLGKALGVWQEMLANGIVPGKVSYQYMVEACLMHPRGMANAIRMVEDMHRQGISVEDEYNDGFVQAFKRASDLKETVTDVFADKSASGAAGDLAVGSPRRDQGRTQVNEIALGVILSACKKKEDTPTMQRALLLMKQHGVQPEESVMEYLDNVGRRPRSKSQNHNLKRVDKIVRNGSAVPFLREQRLGAEYRDFQNLLDGEVRASKPEPESTPDQGEAKVRTASFGSRGFVGVPSPSSLSALSSAHTLKKREEETRIRHEAVKKAIERPTKK